MDAATATATVLKQTDFRPEQASISSEPESVGKRFTALRGNIHNKSITSENSTIGTAIMDKMPKIGAFFTEQQNISKDNISFIKSDASALKKVATYLIGSTVSGVVDALYNAAGAVSSLVKAVLNLTIGMAIEAGKGIVQLVMGGDDIKSDFKGRFITVKDHATDFAKNINHVVRNVIRAVPVVGHFLGEGFNKVETAVIMGVEVVAGKAKGAYNYVFPAKVNEAEEA